jgi:hypothetical protein
MSNRGTGAQGPLQAGQGGKQGGVLQSTGVPRYLVKAAPKPALLQRLQHLCNPLWLPFQTDQDFGSKL